jgi:hypothetical protein
VDSTIPNVKGQLLSIAAQFEALAEQALLERYEPKRDDTVNWLALDNSLDIGLMVSTGG